MIELLIVEDNLKLQPALVTGLEQTGKVKVVGTCTSGEEALEQCLEYMPGAMLMDVELSGEINGVEAGVRIRREFPRMPILFYSIQDDDEYYRSFQRSGILSHYGYVRKTNYLLPSMILPLLQDAVDGKSFIDQDIEARVQEVRQKDRLSPMDLLEPNEREVARMIAQGMNNQQIAARFGFRDKRTISRTNGQIYVAWGLNESSTDEKIARTRVAIIVREGRMIRWDKEGVPTVQNERGEWVEWNQH